MKHTIKRFGIIALFAVIAIVTACGTTGAAATSDTEVSVPASSAVAAGTDLNIVIEDAAVAMEGKIPEGTTVALVSVGSSSAQLSEYIIGRLEAAIVSSGVLLVVDRANLDRVREEQGFQYSGEVDDESAKEIGMLLGAGAIVTGKFTDLGDVFSLSLKAINMDTATVAVSLMEDVAKSTRIETLLASGGGAGGSASLASGNNAEARDISVQAAQVEAKPAGLQNGTYTFYPRLQPYRGAVPAENIYLERIVIRGDYMNIYLNANPTGNTDTELDWRYNNSSLPVLQDLDNPSRSYTPERSNNDAYNHHFNISRPDRWYTFKGIKGKRYSLSFSPPSEVPTIFDEIILGEPDAE
jgi:hypothetical protein